MKHPERKDAKRFDSPDRCARFTEIVYGGETFSHEEGVKQAMASLRAFEPPKNPYMLYYGDLHGHTNLSDGKVDPDVYFRNLRDLARMDFCALSDHDHGGIGHAELWDCAPGDVKSKWEIGLEKADQYNESGVFTTIPAYERDSYPWFNNMVLYYRDSRGMRPYRGAHDGEITRDELCALSQRADILYGPHTCSCIDSGSYLRGRAPELMPKTFEIFSRGGAYEYYDNPFPAGSAVRGSCYIDALESGAHPACIACSDDHDGEGGRDIAAKGYGYTGMTGVYAEENTREAIFTALKARRCFACMGAERILVDFRINGHFMGEMIADESDRRDVFFRVESKTPVARVDLVKNGRSEVFYRGKSTALLFDYDYERPEDYYYLRVTFADGRLAWTSPIWVCRGEK